MDRLTARQKHATRLGFVGILLVVLGLKFLFQWNFAYSPPLRLEGKPTLLFFTLDQPCECIQELVQQADEQINAWPETERKGIPLIRIDFDTRKDLADKYHVFRVLCLVLVDADGEIVHRQDYPLIEGGPFELAEFEARMQNLSSIK